MGGHENPWESPLDDAYWEALLSQGESPPEPVLPVNEMEVLHRLGAEFTFDPTDEREACELSTSRELAPSESAFSEAKQFERDWGFISHCFETGEILKLEVTGYNRGGLLVRLNLLQGFVPASQLIEIPRYQDESKRQAELARYVGKSLHLKIIALDREQKRIVLSEREAALESQRAEDLWMELREGEIRRGRVSNLCSFGAFVDLGGIEGLIHISEMSWQKVERSNDVLKIGQEVEVYVLGVDREQKRVALSLKRLQPDPWSMVEERYKVGQVVQGVITNVVSFGAFARIEDNLEGLIHISELAEGNFLHPRNVVKEGDVVNVRILHIDSARRRLGLSLRQAREPGFYSPQEQ